MRLVASLVLVGLLIPLQANAICFDLDLRQEIQNSQAVFVATIISSSLGRPLSDLHDGDRYLVRYTFSVARQIKGDPAIVTALVTPAFFDDPNDQTNIEFGEQSRFVPGDSLLVIADAPGEVGLSAIGCTPSRPWNSQSLASVADLVKVAP